MTDCPVKEKAGRDGKTRQGISPRRPGCSLDEQLCYCLWPFVYFSPTRAIHPVMIYSIGMLWYITLSFPLTPLSAFVLIGYLN